MFKVNQADWDRMLRVILGAVLLFLSLGGTVTGALGVILFIIGVVLMLTGLVGYCPLYTILKIKTKKS